MQQVPALEPGDLHVRELCEFAPQSRPQALRLDDDVGEVADLLPGLELAGATVDVTDGNVTFHAGGRHLIWGKAEDAARKRELLLDRSWPENGIKDLR